MPKLTYCGDKWKRSTIFILNFTRFWIYSVSASRVFTPPVTNYMLLYRTLLFKKITRAPGGRKNISLLSWGGGGGAGGQNRIYPDFLCNGTCSVTGGSLTYCGHKRKRSTIFILNFTRFFS